MSDNTTTEIKAGEYELVALFWEEIKSKPGEPFDFVRHHQGDTVRLNVADARRLLASGAVKPLGDDDTEPEVPGSRESVPPGSEPGEIANSSGPAAGTADAILASVGSDKDLAQVALDEETARATPRTTLVAKLEKILEA